MLVKVRALKKEHDGQCSRRAMTGTVPGSRSLVMTKPHTSVLKLYLACRVLVESSQGFGRSTPILNDPNRTELSNMGEKARWIGRRSLLYTVSRADPQRFGTTAPVSTGTTPRGAARDARAPASVFHPPRHRVAARHRVTRRVVNGADAARGGRGPLQDSTVKLLAPWFTRPALYPSNLPHSPRRLAARSLWPLFTCALIPRTRFSSLATHPPPLTPLPP